jgi:outer membrane protein OmpA-like peptidoglycan-associated protein
MASKKYTLMAILLVFLQAVGFAQTTTDWGWDWRDTSKIPAKRLPQHSEFLNNNFPYPAQPRDQWELGFAPGASFVFGDVGSKFGWGGGLTLRKAISHTFSARVGYFGSFNYGEPSTYGKSIGQVDYRNRTHMGAIDVIASFTPFSHYRANPKWNIYALAGYSFIVTQVEQKDAAGNYRPFRGVGLPNTQSGIIGTVAGTEVNGRKDWTMLSGINAGGGFAYKVSNKINIGFEQRFTFTAPGYDYLDGIRSGRSNDIYSFSSIRFNVNIGSTAKRVQPLWWINPNNFIYNELNKPAHMKLPKPVLPDADGDGVTDQFDLEPNTPAGARVDNHGRAVDSDGDGIPDYKDKELLTSQKCFPVNNEGVGTCPEPSCCKELRDTLAKLIEEGGIGRKCNIADLPSVQFKNSAKLSKSAQDVLATVAQKIKEAPNCKVKVIGYGATDKKAQQSSWEKVNAVIKYLVEKQGVAESRLIFSYGLEGDANTVDLQGTIEDGPNTVPAPHPNLRGK